MNRKELEAAYELLSGPGDTIKETMEEKGIGLSLLADLLGVGILDLMFIIDNRKPITIELAAKLEKALGISEQFWINREANYRRKLKELALVSDKLTKRQAFFDMIPGMVWIVLYGVLSVAWFLPNLPLHLKLPFTVSYFAGILLNIFIKLQRRGNKTI